LVATPNRSLLLLIGGCGAGSGGVTVNGADALMLAVFAVKVSAPSGADGTTAFAVNAPADVVRNWKVEEPTITVPVVEARNPVPVTATDVPTGPDVGLSWIWVAAAAADGAALAGCKAPTKSPKLLARSTAKYLKTLKRIKLPPTRQRDVETTEETAPRDA
jgi:hypothetical protein